MLQHFVYYRNFATKIQIKYYISYTIVVKYGNYHTILYLFNFVFNVKIAN